MITFYDLIFINLAPYVSSGVLYAIKSWQEYLTLFLLLLLIVYKNKFAAFNKFDRWFLLCFLFLTVTSTVVGLSAGTNIMQIFLGWRMYMMPLIWSFLLYKTSIFKEVSSRIVFYFLGIVSIITVIAGIYQNLSFNGDLRSLWFYDFIDKLNPIDEHSFDFVRDDKLRVTGIFVSPLIYASFLSYSLLVFMFYNIFKKGAYVKKIFATILIVFVGYGQILSRTRIGFIILIVGLCCSFLIYFRPLSKFGWSISIPLLFVITTLVSLIVGITDDLSALGRLIQYASLPSNFVLQGLGFGAEMTNVFFDSFYISVAVLFGAFVPIYLWLYLVLLKKINKKAIYVRYIEGNVYDKILYYSSYGFFFSFIYTFGFHFSIASPTVQIFYLMLFYFISRPQIVQQEQNNVVYGKVLQ